VTLTVADMPALDREIAEDAPRTIRGSTIGADCVNCPFSRMGRPNQPVTGEGWERPNWIVVGEGPGSNEVIQSRPFVGSSGRLVNEALAKIGVAREALWVTNATLCQPPSGATDHMKRLARQACAPRLRQELVQFPGRPILALGAISAQGFCGEKFSITQMAGAFYEIDVDDSGQKRPVIPSIHPAAILRGGSSSGGGGSHTVDLAFWNLLYDAQKVNLLARGVDIKFTDDIEIELEDPKRAEQLIAAFVREARVTRKFACDTETYVDNPKQHTALAPVNAKLSAIGLATTARAISVAWTIVTPRAKSLLNAIFADSTITKLFHNRIYDVPVLQRHGFTLNGPIHCTMLMHHSAFPGLAHNLQRVLTQFYAAPPWKAEYRHGVGTLAELLPYNARDTLATARIEAPIAVIIKRSQAEKTYEVDLAMAHAATVMHVKGVPIDRGVNDQLRTGFRAHIDKARAELNAKVLSENILPRYKERLAFEQARKQRKHDPLDLDQRIQKRLDELEKKQFQFLVDSGDHVVAFLKACGVPLSIQTASGRISTKKDILESFVNYPEVRALLTYRENAKLLSTYIERMFDRHYPNGKVLYGFCDDNDRAHPRWSVHKITGRWGSEAPVCFDGETEILTEYGWTRFDELTHDVRVAQYHLDRGAGAIDFVMPTQYVKKQHDGEMIRLAGQAIDLFVTPDHRFPVRYRRKSRTWRDIRADEWRSDYHLPVAGNYVGGTWSPDRSYLSLLCAAQADGSWNGYGWDFSFTKKRKVRRLHGALKRLGLSFRVNEKTEPNPFRAGEMRTRKRTYVHQSAVGTEIANRLGLEEKKPGKGIFGPWLLELTTKTMTAFRDEVMFWDGCHERDSQFSSSQKTNADWVQIACALTGRRAKVRRYVGNGGLQIEPNWQVDVAKRTNRRQRGAPWYITTNQAKKGVVDWKGTVYCVSVPSTYIVVRRNGRVVIAGNCQNVPKADKKKGRPNLRSQVIAPHGRGFVAFDAKQLEARLIALMSGDAFLLDIFHKDKDIHSEFARIVWPDFDSLPVDERKVRRDLIKRPEYGAFYAGSVETLWKSVVRDYPNVTISMIGKMVHVMKTRMPGVTAWHQNMMRMADRDGEIRSMILGRRRCFPIKQFDLSEVVNFPIQSSGADLINLGLMDIMPRLPATTFPILQIHDAVVFECDEDDQDLVKRLVVESFTRDVEYNGNTMNFPVDAKAGHTWAEVN